MKVDKGAGPQLAQPQPEPTRPSAPKARTGRAELEAAIEKGEGAAVARSVGELIEGRAARRVDGALARRDAWSTGIRLTKPSGGGGALGTALSAVECAKFKARFAEASGKVGAVAAAVLATADLMELRAAWLRCGDTLGAIASAKAGLWSGAEKVSDAGISVATASLSQICSKVELTTLGVHRPGLLGELHAAWHRGQPLASGLDPTQAGAFERLWQAIAPDVANLRAALEPFTLAVGTLRPPPQTRWGQLG